ncbi:hypothetical protein LX88_000216 [Lentzea californiensis]|uniref:Uncharacterized protein n=2 Tax=Pseudonocardiaceae TaxID=2070 RepID=A0A1H9TRF9_9PSEU|nr:hypothetical protein [Lentzea californiensis]RDI33506.1 hypothetical protein DFR72_102755 [Lentzea flaviverrucosa]SER99629.1 hypothetical protein SAMN05216195_108101 [Lentzea flaviverrucosa]
MHGMSLVLSAAVEGSMTGTAAGPVGLIAVTAGVGGLLYGLVKRRKPAPVVAANQRIDLVQQDTAHH